MAAKIGAAFFHGLDILGAKVVFLHAAIHFHGAHGGDQHHTIGGKPGLAAFDIHEFLGAKIGPETGFRHHIIGQFQRGCGGNDRVAAMRDIGERAAMHEGGVVFERLHKVRLHGLLEQHGHGAIGLDVAAIDRRFVAAIGDDDIAKALFEVGQILGQAQDCHDFRGDGNVKPRLARKAVGYAAKVDHNIAQGTVIHVHHAAPDNAARVNLKFVAPIDMVVDHRAQQVMGRGDRMKIAREMQVHFFHRHNLRQSTARSPALHAEIRPEAGFANADHCFLANGVQPVAKPDRGCGLALARRCGVDGGHQDQLAVLAAFQRFDESFGNLRLVMAKGQQIIAGNAESRANFLNRAFFGFAGNFDIGLVCHDVLFLLVWANSGIRWQNAIVNMGYCDHSFVYFDFHARSRACGSRRGFLIVIG